MNDQTRLDRRRERLPVASPDILAESYAIQVGRNAFGQTQSHEQRLAQLRDPGAPVTANVIGGFTDCNAFRAKGKTCYGFLPVRVDPAELGRVHGKDERANVEALARAVIDLHALIDQVGAAASAAAATGAASAIPAASTERAARGAGTPH